MTDSKSNSYDEIEDDEQHRTTELETLTRGEDWGEKAFRDVGEATFSNR